MLSVISRRTLFQTQRRYSVSHKLCALRAPTAKDEEVLLDLLNNREGAIINNPDILKKYNSDWSVSSREGKQDMVAFEI